MAITPLDIQEKTFSSALFGYSKAEVEEFLEQVAEALKEVQRENNALKDQITRLEKDLARYQEEERTIREAIVKAQALAEELKAQAEKEAENIVAQARNEAQALKQEAEAERRRIQEEIAQLKQERERLYLELKATLDTWKEYLETKLQAA